VRRPSSSPSMANIMFKLQLIITTKTTVTLMAMRQESHKYHQSFSIENPTLYCKSNKQ
jgi:hypothetical protein